jgi:hypothetical protein
MFWQRLPTSSKHSSKSCYGSNAPRALIETVGTYKFQKSKTGKPSLCLRFFCDFARFLSFRLSRVCAS